MRWSRPSVRPALGWSLLVLVVGAFGAAEAQGLLLYDNGPVTDPAADGRCDSAISFSCGGDGNWTFYDNFVLASDAVMTELDYVDWFAFGSLADPEDYVSTDWSLFDADPFTAAPVAAGNGVATLTPTGPESQFRFAVDGLSVGLQAGVEYWLGTRNNLTGVSITTVARVGNPGGGLDAAKHADGAGNQVDLPSSENRAFRIHGTIVPEPASGGLLAAGLAALAAGRRRRARGVRA